MVQASSNKIQDHLSESTEMYEMIIIKFKLYQNLWQTDFDR